MAAKTYLVRGYYPGLGLRFWYSSTPNDLFADYPPADSYYPTPTTAYTDVVIYDTLIGGTSSGTGGDGYSLLDFDQVAAFDGDIVAGEPLILTSTGLVKAYADTHDSVYGLAAISTTAINGITVLPVVIAGKCLTGDMGTSSLSWNIGDSLYLASVAMGDAGVTSDVATLSTTEATNVIKIGTWSSDNVITVSISFILYTG